MLTTTLMALPFSAQAGKFPNTDLSITSSRADNGLPVGQAAKAPDAIFEVTCNDNNGAEWIVGNGSATYWATSSGTKLTSSDTISQYSSYKLQLCVYPDVVNTEEDEVDINEVKQITFNGVPLTTSQYRRGELGNSIYITVNFYYVGFTNASGNKSGFYCMGQEIPVTANDIDGKHFVMWGGTYYTGSGSQSVSFADATKNSTSLKVPYSSMPISVSPQYADHTYTNKVAKAKIGTDGKIVNACSACGDVASTTVIPKVSSIKLSATSYTYDGKVKTPSVIVKDSKGKTLVNNKDYTVSYASGRKSVGQYAVKITFKGNYTGTNTVYFAIKPKATSISSPSAISKGLTAKWKKQTSQTTGYQVQIATNSKFTKGVKSYTVSKNKTVSKKITKLKGKKKYYVRVRTYKTVKVNGKSTKIYSSWSKAEAVKTKK